MADRKSLSFSSYSRSFKSCCLCFGAKRFTLRISRGAFPSSSPKIWGLKKLSSWSYLIFKECSIKFFVHYLKARRCSLRKSSSKLISKFPGFFFRDFETRAVSSLWSSNNVGSCTALRWGSWKELGGELSSSRWTLEKLELKKKSELFGA